MGYRSQSKWIITGPAESITVAWVLCRLKLIPPVEEGLPANLWDNFKVFRIGETGYIRFSYEAWKWYDDYPDVQFYESVWSCLADCEGICGRRIRVGEDEYDIETDQFGDAPEEIDLCTVTSILDGEPDEGEPLTGADHG